ncbi:MAG: helix-turn-helix transcriptional regulator [Myxococcales bacterium]|nr:helix-turn-helix transcriptional regulator [Myxococcales bacterium]
MARRTSVPLPRVARVLAQLGQNIRLARTRRRLSAELCAERAGMSRPTLRAIERGDGGVTIGAIANVLHSLGLVDDLARVASEDELGRKLEDALLESKQRVRRTGRAE